MWSRSGLWGWREGGLVVGGEVGGSWRLWCRVGFAGGAFGHWRRLVGGDVKFLNSVDKQFICALVKSGTWILEK